MKYTAVFFWPDGLGGESAKMIHGSGGDLTVEFDSDAISDRNKLLGLCVRLQKDSKKNIASAPSKRLLVRKWSDR